MISVMRVSDGHLPTDGEPDRATSAQGIQRDHICIWTNWHRYVDIMVDPGRDLLIKISLLLCTNVAAVPFRQALTQNPGPFIGSIFNQMPSLLV